LQQILIIMKSKNTQHLPNILQTLEILNKITCLLYESKFVNTNPEHKNLYLKDAETCWHFTNCCIFEWTRFGICWCQSQNWSLCCIKMTIHWNPRTQREPWNRAAKLEVKIIKNTDTVRETQLLDKQIDNINDGSVKLTTTKTVVLPESACWPRRRFSNSFLL
jgi:hypothetical protein